MADTIRHQCPRCMSAGCTMVHDGTGRSCPACAPYEDRIRRWAPVEAVDPVAICARCGITRDAHIGARSGTAYCRDAEPFVPVAPEPEGPQTAGERAAAGWTPEPPEADPLAEALAILDPIIHGYHEPTPWALARIRRGIERAMLAEPDAWVDGWGHPTTPPVTVDGITWRFCPVCHVKGEPAIIPSAAE